MQTTLIILSLLLLAASAVSFLIFLVKKIMKKKTVTGKVALISLIAGFVLFLVSFGLTDPTMTLMLGGFIMVLVAFVALIVTAIRKAVKKTWLKSLITAGVAVVLCVSMFVISDQTNKADLKDPTKYEVKTVTSYDFEVVDGDTPIEVIKSDGFETGENGYQARYRRIYDSDANHLVFDKTDATIDDCIASVKNSEYLDKRFKDFFTDFITRIGSKYPDADLSILYHNLATLKVIELDKVHYFTKSLSVDSYGCYRIDENVIYIPEGTEYVEGTWGFQVLIHEFCHAVRTSRWETDDEKFINWVAFDAPGSDRVLMMEAMNSVFSCSLLNYEEKDIAYQVPSNYMRIMLECMDNYSLSDYINHGDTYFFSKLDEYMGDTNYANVIWKLIAVQRADYQDENMILTADKYYPIYDYICEMYYDKYITDGMTDAEMKAVADELVEKAFFDAPEEYTISPEYFYEYLDSYAANMVAES